MDESIVKHLQEPEVLTKPKLSALIRAGHSMCKEDKDVFLMDWPTLRGCALGAVWLASGKSYAEYDRLRVSQPHGPMIRALSEHLGLPERVVREVSYKHYTGTPRLEIAAELERQGL